jgi:uncharacterized protein (TIGR04255 family)
MSVENPQWPNGVDDLYSLLRQRYDGLPVISESSSDQFTPSFARLDLENRSVTLRNKSDSETITLSGSSVMIRNTPPYQGWGAFTQRIDELIGVFNKFFPQLSISALSLTFENLLAIPANQKHTDYISSMFSAPSSSGTQVDSSYTVVRYGEVSLTLMQYRQRSDDRKLLSVDITATDSFAPPILFAGYQKPLGSLHDKIVAQFESLITDRARELFGTK